MKYINDFQLQIEDFYGCTGSCLGCMLSSVERSNKKPQLDLQTLQQIFSKMQQHVQQISTIERVQVVFGISDHLILPLDYLEMLFVEGAQFIKKSGIEHSQNGIFFSANMIGKTEHIMKKINYLYDLSRRENIRLFFTVVLDPNIFNNPKLLNVFTTNLKETFKLTQSLDLTINLSYDTINILTPQKLVAYCQEFQVPNLIINWVPTKDNFNNVYKNIHELSEWLIQLMKESNKNIFSLTFPETIKKIFMHTQDYNEQNMTLTEMFDEHFQYMSVNNLIVNPKGKVFINFEAIGDIPHNENFNILELGNVFDHHTIFDMLNNKKDFYKKLTIKNINNPTCLSCEFMKECALSGFNYYTYLLNEIHTQSHDLNFIQEKEKTLKSIQCFHLAKNLISFVKNTQP